MATAEVEALLEQQKSTRSENRQPEKVSHDGFLAPSDTLEEALWDCFPLDDRSFGTAISSETESFRHSADWSQSAPRIEKDPASWELSAVGLQEPLPNQQAIDEL